MASFERTSSTEEERKPYYVNSKFTRITSKESSFFIRFYMEQRCTTLRRGRKKKERKKKRKKLPLGMVSPKEAFPKTSGSSVELQMISFLILHPGNHQGPTAFEGII